MGKHFKYSVITALEVWCWGGWPGAAWNSYRRLQIGSSAGPEIWKPPGVFLVKKEGMGMTHVDALGITKFFLSWKV